MKKYLTALLFLLLLASCTKTIVKLSANLKNKGYYIQKFSNDSTEVVFIGAMHVNKPDYYQKIKRDVDSLRERGYTVLYEGLKRDTSLSSADLQTVNKKFRKITGFHLSAYLDKTNKDVRKFQAKGLVNQTLSNTGINPNVDVRADFSLDSLIALYEKNKGPIILNDCDLKTPLGEKYKCGKVDKKNFDYLIVYLRDQHLMNTIIQQKSNKIAILYGDLHKYGILRNLKIHDSTWRMVRPGEN